MTYLTRIICFCSVFSQISSFNLSNYNISLDYFVSSIAITSNRAFLALPRSSCFNNISNPTLVEASWPPEHSNSFTKNRKPFFINDQEWNNCDNLQDVISLDIEQMRKRLWVLDKGNENCPGKIAIYNLFQKINYTVDAPDYISYSKMNYLLIDPSLASYGTRAYIGLAESDFLLVFSMNEFKWWKIPLETEQNLQISTQFLAMSRRNSFLYFTGQEEREIYFLDLKQLRKPLEDEVEPINVTFFGEKLGPSTSLVTDFRDGLTYFLTRDYAIVRWDTHYPSEAEYYSVLGQSYEILPFVSQLFTGPQNGIFALVNKGKGNNCSESLQDLQLEQRTVKLLKYNIIV